MTTLKPLFEDTIEKISHAIINGTGYNIGDLFVMKTDDMEAISSLPTLSVKRWKVSPVDLFRGMAELSKLKKISTEDYKIQGYYIKALVLLGMLSQACSESWAPLSDIQQSSD